MGIRDSYSILGTVGIQGGPENEAIHKFGARDHQLEANVIYLGTPDPQARKKWTKDTVYQEEQVNYNKCPRIFWSLSVSLSLRSLRDAPGEERNTKILLSLGNNFKISSAVFHTDWNTN